MDRRRKRLVAAAALGVLLSGSASAQVYVVTDLGTLGGGWSEAAALNNLGHVVGSSRTADGETHAFLHRDGVILDLGTLAGGTYSHATGVNDLGHVVGYGGMNLYGEQFRELMSSFRWENGSMLLPSGFYCHCSFNERHPVTAAYGVNAASRMVGTAKNARQVMSAYLWEDGFVADVSGDPVLFSTSAARAINERGQIVGDRLGRAFLTQDGATLDLGLLPGGSVSNARAINAVGQVVGEADRDGAAAVRAFLWEGGGLQDLGVLPGDESSRARGLNAESVVVGESIGRAESRAFVWRDGVMLDLNALVPRCGWRLTSAAAINDAGQIAGTGLVDGAVRAFLLTPVPEADSVGPRTARRRALRAASPQPMRVAPIRRGQSRRR